MLTQTTTLYVSVVEGPCESERVPVPARVIALPPAPTVANQERCEPGPVTLRADGVAGSTYRWYAADGITPLADGTQATYTTDVLSESTDFYVAALTEGCEGERAQVTAHILIPPQPPVIDEVTLCQPDSAVLRVENPTEGGTYRWYDQPTDGTLLQEDNTGAYAVQVVSDTALHVSVWNGSCESERIPAVATIYREGSLDAGPDERILPDGDTQLEATEGYSQYAWYPSEGLSDTQISNPVANPTQTTTYWVTAVTAAGCEEVDQLTVEVVDYPIPNAFTPNNDGLNDRWDIPFLDRYPACEVAIYNRWGEIVYQSEGYRDPWDGRTSGQSTAALGTYTYVIDLNNGKPLHPGKLWFC